MLTPPPRHPAASRRAMRIPRVRFSRSAVPRPSSERDDEVKGELETTLDKDGNNCNCSVCTPLPAPGNTLVLHHAIQPNAMSSVNTLNTSL